MKYRSQLWWEKQRGNKGVTSGEVSKEGRTVILTSQTLAHYLWPQKWCRLPFVCSNFWPAFAFYCHSLETARRIENFIPTGLQKYMYVRLTLAVRGQGNRVRFCRVPVFSRMKNGRRAIAQAVSRWLPTAAGRLRNPAKSIVISCCQNCARAGFLPSTSVSPANLHSTNFFHNHLSSGAGTIGQQWPQYKKSHSTNNNNNNNNNNASRCPSVTERKVSWLWVLPIFQRRRITNFLLYGASWDADSLALGQEIPYRLRNTKAHYSVNKSPEIRGPQEHSITGWFLQEEL
jgi:hypothetical protein